MTILLCPTNVMYGAGLVLAQKGNHKGRPYRDMV